ncbi:hypothetical protein GE09DRAFT_1141034 [Coniochaeta sp. 2T2.1]|nr:hypothetical protein GE09DRAFT_1141034 [Coniochaeta sp. 2T2.1]
MGRLSSQQKKAKGSEIGQPHRKSKHPADKKKNSIQPPKVHTPRNGAHSTSTFLPRMNDPFAAAPIHLRDNLGVHKANGTPKTPIELVKRLWTSMPGFSFPPVSLSILNQDAIAKVVLNFNASASAKSTRHHYTPGHHDFLRFLVLFFERMKGHEYGYPGDTNSEDANAKAFFFAFARMELYNVLVVERKTRGVSPATARETARALASFEVSLLMRVVEGLVDGRRKFLAEEDRRALLAVATAGNSTTVAGPQDGAARSEKAQRSAKKKAEAEFQKAGRALVAMLGDGLTLGQGEDVDAEESGDRAVEEDKTMRTVEEDGMEESKQKVNYLPQSLLKEVCSAVDDWIRHLDMVTSLDTRGQEWKKVFE